MIYSESHDEIPNGKARVTSEIDASNLEGSYEKKQSTLAAAIALMSPGVPMLFQGQEMLEDEWFRIRTRSIGKKQKTSQALCECITTSSICDLSAEPFERANR